MKKHRSRIIMSVISIVLAAAGFYFFVLPQLHHTAGGKSDVVKLTVSNYLNEMQTNTGPAIVEICPSDVCSMEQSAFAAASVKYQGKVTFYEVDYTPVSVSASATDQSNANPVAEQFISSLEQAEVSAGNTNGVPISFPMFLYTVGGASASSGPQIGNVTEGLLTASDIESFTSQSLNPPKTSSTGSTSSSSTGSTSTGSTSTSSSGTSASTSKASGKTK